MQGRLPRSDSTSALFDQEGYCILTSEHACLLASTRNKYSIKRYQRDANFQNLRSYDHHRSFFKRKVT